MNPHPYRGGVGTPPSTEPRYYPLLRVTKVLIFPLYVCFLASAACVISAASILFYILLLYVFTPLFSLAESHHHSAKLVQSFASGLGRIEHGYWNIGVGDKEGWQGWRPWY